VNKQDILVIGFLGFVGVVVLIAALSTFSFLISPTSYSATMNISDKLMRMDLTSFDRELAIKLMDKNHDGKCDVCGMDVELCIASGQIQCNMDSKSTIGILGSAHIHADFKVYVNEEPIDFAKLNYYMKSSFIHVDDNQNKEDASGTLHMHATGVPLWIFFRSVGTDFDKNCLTLLNQEKFCNDGKNILKFYVNGKPNEKWGNYAFNDLDKILISYGNETDLTQQLNSITDFAKNH